MNRAPFLLSKRRPGAAFLMLVVMILLVVVGATQTLLRNELTLRRGETDRIRVRTLRAAIEAVQSADSLASAGDESAPIRLPLDDSSGQFIEVTINQDQSQITARWTKGGRVIDEMTHRIQTKRESTE